MIDVLGINARKIDSTWVEASDGSMEEMSVWKMNLFLTIYDIGILHILQEQNLTTQLHLSPGMRNLRGRGRGDLVLTGALQFRVLNFLEIHTYICLFNTVTLHLTIDTG